MKALRLALALAFVASPAFAQDATPAPKTDYGRADSDFGVVLGAGPVFAPRGTRAAIDLRFRYADTIGLYGGYEDALGGATDPRRVVGGGLELRPLYALRSKRLLGRELGLARLDLMIDSLGFQLGAYAAQERGSQLATRPGLQVGLGFEVPVFANATGFWLDVRGGLRWSDGALAGDPIRGPADRSGYFALSLAWHQIFGRAK